MDTNTDTNMNLHSDSESNTGKEFHTVAYTDTRRIPEEYQKLCLNVKTFYGLLPIPNVVPIVRLVRVR